MFNETPNLETDSTSLQISDSEFSQLKKTNRRKIPNDQTQLLKDEDDEHPLNEIVFESSISNNENLNNKDLNLLSTDSTSINESSNQFQEEIPDNFNVDGNTDSTEIESSEILSDTNMRSKKSKVYYHKTMRTIVDSRMKNNPKYTIQNDFLFTRPENNLRTKYHFEFSNNDNLRYKTIFSNNNTISSSGRSVHYAINDNLRTAKKKKNPGFDPVPMEQITVKKQKPQVSSRNSQNSTISNQPSKSTEMTPSIILSNTETPTPISGFVVTDSNPSPHHITLEQTEDPIITAMNRLIEFGEIPPIEIRKQVIYMLKRESVDAMVKEEYDRAQTMEKAQIYMRDFLRRELFQKKTEFEKNAIETKIKSAEYELKLETQEWDELLVSLKEQQSRDKAKLKQKHSDEQEEFNKKWAQHSTLMPFNKPSPQLLQLRKMQKNLALTKNFTEAKAVKKRADDLQKVETIEAEKRIKEAIWTSYQTLLEKQKRELSCFDEHSRRCRDYITLKKQELIKPIQKLIKSLKTGYPCFYITEDNSENRRKAAIVTSSSLNSQQNSAAASTCSSSRTKLLPKEKPIQPTPRTKKAIVEFRKDKEPTKLNINSSVIKDYMNNRKSAPTVKLTRVPK